MHEWGQKISQLTCFHSCIRGKINLASKCFIYQKTLLLPANILTVNTESR